MTAKTKTRNYGSMTLAALILIGFLCISANDAAAATTATTATDLPATNMVVDFSSINFASTVHRGDNGVLNLVIKNTGGFKAELVEVLIPSTGVIQLDKHFNIGRVDPSESKTIPIIFRISDTAKTGLTSIPVQISYTGFKSDGTSNANQVRTFEVPLNVIGNPLFQINSAKTTYYLNTLGYMNLTGYTKDAVKDLTVTISSSDNGGNSNQRGTVNVNSNTNSTSSCITVIGSSRAYVGNVGSNQTFNLAYMIKPTEVGPCVGTLHLSYTDDSGIAGSDDVEFGLNIEDAGVNLNVMNISYDPTGPGQEADVVLTLKNVGHADADDVDLSLNMTSPFSPLDSQEKYIPHIAAGETVDVTYKIGIDISAVTQTYSLPLSITYKVGGTSQTDNKDIGIDVSGEIQLAVMNVDTSKGNVRIAVSNIGTRDANGVKATLIVPNTNGTGTGGFGGRRGGGASQTNETSGEQAINRTGGPRTGADSTYLIAYQSNIKATKQATFTFTTASTGPAQLIIEYTGINNKRINQTQTIFLAGTGTSGTYGSSGTSTMTYVYYLVAIIAIYLVYRYLKNRKK